MASENNRFRGKLGTTTDDAVAQVRALLECPEQNVRTTLLKEMLLSVLRLKDSPLDTLDIKILHRTLRELRYAFRVFQPYRERRKVSIFGSARTLTDDPNYNLAYRFARKLVESNYMVITGGADGIMRAGHEGAGRESSFGVNIMLPFEQGANAIISDDPKLITFKYFFTRKLLFVKEAHAAALFPGGFGTHDEGFEILTLVQTGKSDPKPIVCLQVPGYGYWDSWRDFLVAHLSARRLINEEDLSLFKIVESEDEAIQEIETFYRRYHSIRFIEKCLVMRLMSPLTEEQLALVNQEFGDLLTNGCFEQRPSLPGENDEPTLQGLPRLVFRFNRQSAGRLRQLIDRINAFPAPSMIPTTIGSQAA